MLRKDHPTKIVQKILAAVSPEMVGYADVRGIVSLPALHQDLSYAGTSIASR
jgi:hypothetical protein